MIRIKLFGTGPRASLDLQLGMVGWWWVGWRRSTGVVLQRLRAAAGGCSGEWRWRGRVGDGWRSVGRYRANRGAGQGDACACARSNDVDILGLDRSDVEAAAFNDKVSPSQPTHKTTKKKE